MNHRGFAIALSMEAGNIMRKDFTLGMHKDWKEDNTPLTRTDVAINELVVDRVHDILPDHGVLAEEGSNFNGEEYVWVCDPIDGTNPFSHGYPTFTFSLALVHRGQPILGLLYDPILGRLVVAESGKGALLTSPSRFIHDLPIKVSRSPLLTRSLVSIESGNPRFNKLRNDLVDMGNHVATFVCITYSSMLVAMGEIAGAIWDGNTPWDAAAVQVIIEEAGGVCTNIEGEQQRYDGPVKGIVVGPKEIHRQLIEMIRKN